MQDQSNGEFHRYTPEANLLISLMDGRRSVQQIWRSPARSWTTTPCRRTRSSA